MKALAAILLPFEIGFGLWAGLTTHANIGGALLATAVISILFLADR
jgi:hypothetical protein